MNVSSSQCGSGSESGWTHYLDQSSNYSQTQYPNFDDECYGGKGMKFVVEYEEEDLSMVSDASSGPRNYCCQDYEESLDENGIGSFFSAPLAYEALTKSGKSRKKIKEHGRYQQESYLDDTASSSVISFSKKNYKKEASNVLEFSQGFSGTHFKSKSALQKKFGFWKAEKADSKDAGGYQGRNWE